MDVARPEPVGEGIGAGAEDGGVEVCGGEEGRSVDEGAFEARCRCCCCWRRGRGVAAAGEEAGVQGRGVEEVGVLCDVDCEVGGEVGEVEGVKEGGGGHFVLPGGAEEREGRERWERGFLENFLGDFGRSEDGREVGERKRE